MFQASFGYLPSLRSLYLNQCDCSEFGRSSLETFKTSLRELHILDCVSIAHVDLSVLKRLKKLCIRNVSSVEFLETVNKDSLCELDLNKSFRRHKIEWVFEKIRRFEKLETLNLSYNQIEEFDINWLSGFAFLKCISVNYCQMKTIKLSSEAERIPRLEKLDLSNNLIDRVAKDMFCELACLKSLDLSKNKLESLPDGVFADLISLEKLSISHNRITQVCVGTFVGLVSLRELSLACNPLRDLDPHALSHMNNLEKVHLNGTNLDNGDAMIAIREFYANKLITFTCF